jgi:hypothetical protein
MTYSNGRLVDVRVVYFRMVDGHMANSREIYGREVDSHMFDLHVVDGPHG